MTFATQNVIDTDQFNECKRVSGRDFLLRIRRSRQKNYRNILIPTPRPARKLMEEVHSKLENRELYIGEKIAPKMFKTNRIDKSGTLTELDYTVYGRMIPLKKIIQHMREMHKDYQRETETNETHTRHLKIWHDHSDILNHTYISILVSTLYDTASFITDEEYRAKYPERPPADVQAMVEKPFLHVLGQSSSSDVDQLSYISVRVEELQNLKAQSGEVRYVMRFFSGDGPARQFEAGHQRGGNFAC